MQQQNLKHKKFTHNRMKACLERNDQEDKENRIYHEDFRNKKFSVELPSKSIDPYEINPKSIFNQQISVTLNTSNTRCNTFDRDIIGLDVKNLTHSLCKQRDQGATVDQILTSTEIKSIQIKFLIERILQCLKSEDKNHNSSMVSEKQIDYSTQTQLNQTQMRPYIEREIDYLQKNYEKLKQEKDNYLSISTLNTHNKMMMLKDLKQIHERQVQEMIQYM